MVATVSSGLHGSNLQTAARAGDSFGMDRSSTPESEVVRLRVSIGGKFVQNENGTWKYVGGETFLESVPMAWRYADVVFSLAEKVNGAISVKYQLPGEDLDPDSLISLSDDSDVQELYDEYLRALRLPGTPVKTFRLRLFLFGAAEEPYTPEDLAAEARYLDLLPSGPSSVAAPVFDADGTCSEFSAVGSAPGDGATTPSTAAETELAWEAGFRAGQEMAIMASEEEWTQVLNRRMAGLARVASSYMMGGGWQEEEQQAWRSHSPPLTLPAPGHAASGAPTPSLPPRSFDSAAAANAAAAAHVGRRSSSAAPFPSAPDARPAAPSVHMADVEADADADPEFRSMFESKYQLPEGASSAGGRSSQRSPPLPLDTPPDLRPPLSKTFLTPVAPGLGVRSAAAQRCTSPNSLLPSHISVFGDDLAQDQAAALEGLRQPFAPRSPVNLPTHISEFGDEEGGGLDAAVDALVRGALPEEDLLEGAGGTPPDAARLPTEFDLLAGTAGGEGALPGDFRRSASVEEMLSTVQRMDASQVTVVAKIGEGAFGEVSLCECPTYGRVAVKWIKPTKVERHWAAFWHEAELMSRLNHPNVLRFYGLVTQGHMVVGIMTEFAAGGSLAAALRSGLIPGNFIPLRQRTQLALHAVNGMAYLHAQKVVHFDVKPDNLLVDGDWSSPGGPVVKVADFGLSVVKYNTFCSNVQDLRGTLPYMAPEMVTDHRHVTEKADVWSLGVVLWELLTLRVPHADTPPAALIGALGSGAARLPLPEWCEAEWRAVIESCWVLDPELRPTCRQLALQLERIRDVAPAAGS